MTFADLMSLLLCFFVLLLSFAEMDIIKFKQVAGSMKMAMGVQRDVSSSESDQAKEFLKRQSADIPKYEETGKPDAVEAPDMKEILAALKAAEEAVRAEEQEEAIDKLSAAMMEDIEKGMVQIKIFLIRVRSIQNSLAKVTRRQLPVS